MARFLAGKADRKKYLLVAAFLQRFGSWDFFFLSIIQPLLNLPNALTLVHLFCHEDLQNVAQWFLCACLDRFYGQDGPA